MKFWPLFVGVLAYVIWIVRLESRTLTLMEKCNTLSEKYKKAFLKIEELEKQNQELKFNISLIQVKIEKE